MTKLLRAVLMGVALLGGVSRAEDTPVRVADEPGMVTLAVKKVRRIALRLKGRVLGSLVREGMTQEEVFLLLGHPGGIWGSSFHWSYLYCDLGLTVGYKFQRDAKNESVYLVDGVSFHPLFD